MEKLTQENLEQVIGGRRNSVRRARRWSRSSGSSFSSRRSGSGTCTGGRR